MINPIPAGRFVFVRSTVPCLISRVSNTEETVLPAPSTTRSSPSAKSKTSFSAAPVSVEVSSVKERLSAPAVMSLTLMTKLSTPAPRAPFRLIAPAFGAFRVNVSAASVP